MARGLLQEIKRLQRLQKERCSVGIQSSRYQQKYELIFAEIASHFATKVVGH